VNGGVRAAARRRGGEVRRRLEEAGYIARPRTRRRASGGGWASARAQARGGRGGGGCGNGARDGGPPGRRPRGFTSDAAASARSLFACAATATSARGTCAPSRPPGIGRGTIVAGGFAGARAHSAERGIGLGHRPVALSSPFSSPLLRRNRARARRLRRALASPAPPILPRVIDRPRVSLTLGELLMLPMVLAFDLKGWWCWCVWEEGGGWLATVVGALRGGACWDRDAVQVVRRSPDWRGWGRGGARPREERIAARRGERAPARGSNRRPASGESRGTAPYTTQKKSDRLLLLLLKHPQLPHRLGDHQVRLGRADQTAQAPCGLGPRPRQRC
jgi:hypothetical protein